MPESMFDFIVWWSGMLVWLGVFLCTTLVMGWCCLQASIKMTERFLRVCRIQRAQYWYQQFERLGWVRPELEYRRLVRRNPPASLDDFNNLQAKLAATEQARARKEEEC